MYVVFLFRHFKTVDLNKTNMIRIKKKIMCLPHIYSFRIRNAEPRTKNNPTVSCVSGSGTYFLCCRFSSDGDLHSKLKLNVDLTVAMSCDRKFHFIIRPRIIRTFLIEFISLHTEHV